MQKLQANPEVLAQMMRQFTAGFPNTEDSSSANSPGMWSTPQNGSNHDSQNSQENDPLLAIEAAPSN